MQVLAIIKPNSKHRECVFEGEGGTLVVHVRAPAAEGKANLAAAMLIAEHFGVSKVNVSLVRGQASKYKVFEVYR